MSGNSASAPFVHPALFYRSDADYLAGLVPFVTEGVLKGQPVAVAVPDTRLRLLRDALGDTARDVTLLDMAHEGRNPGRIIARVLRRFVDAHSGQHVRIIGEPIWPGRTDTEYPACVQHEALINAAFAGRDATILCPYDLAGLDDTVIADAYATHPEVWDGEHRGTSSRYAPDAVLDRYNQPLPPGESERFLVTTPAEVADARRFAVALGERAGLAEERVQDLALIVTELVTNSIVHTPGSGELAIWRENGHLVCEVRDTGRLTNLLAGRCPPKRGQDGGMGLLLVNDLADLVRVHTGPKGTTIRALLRV